MQRVAEVLAAEQTPTEEHLPAYRPAAQSVHATVGAQENCPAAQGVHVDAPGSVTVSVTDPAAQSMHVELPAEAA